MNRTCGLDARSSIRLSFGAFFQDPEVWGLQFGSLRPGINDEGETVSSQLVQ